MKTDSRCECCDVVIVHKQNLYFLFLHVILVWLVSAQSSVKAGSSPETSQSALSVFLENRKACASDAFLFINYFSLIASFAVESVVHTFMFLFQCNVPSLPLTLRES